MILGADIETNLVGDLFKLSPIIGLLIIAITYLLINIKQKDKALADKDLKLEAKDKELKELNKSIRENEADNIQMMERMSNMLDKLSDNQRVSDDKVLKELENLKQLLFLHLNK